MTTTDLIHRLPKIVGPGLTPEDLRIARAPFDVHAVRFRLGSWAGNGKYSVLAYIDSRLAVERLSEIDPGFTDKYEMAPGFVYFDDAAQAWLRHHAPLQCSLTVKGVTKVDVGQLPLTAVKPDIDQYPFKKDFKTGELSEPRWEISDKHIKSLYSDAFKRAAAKFGVGAYLYTLKGFEAASKDHDKGFLTAEGLKKQKDRYHKIVTHEAFIKRFGEVRRYGDEITEVI